jgi:hypothetical protein
MRWSRSPPIVTCNEEAIEAERGHHIDLVLRHRAERVAMDWGSHRPPTLSP